MISLIEKSFPLVHKKCERKVINKHSLIFKWSKKKTVTKKNEAKVATKNNEGEEEEGQLPYCVYAHMDVVPVNENDWTVPPFNFFSLTPLSTHSLYEHMIQSINQSINQ
jgi:acetylornithine deacetylase/succinyl-diaminopimelate desuccinylase-like protein